MSAILQTTKSNNLLVLHVHISIHIICMNLT